MTKKDYELLAAAFRNASVLISEASAAQGRRDAWATCVESIAYQLARDNYRFDRKKFLLACCETVADRNSLADLLKDAAA